MRGDPELERRGRLVRRLGAWREMVPGSFVVRRLPCGKPNCRCADGIRLHTAFQLSVLMEGKHRTLHIPAAWAEDVRAKVEMYKRFQDAAAAIAQLNLRRLVRRLEARKKAP
ncbi:MAG: hypothetical protein QN187_09335 [Armatimonadota bacterium]|nr:hypothetical protein [Armatimonadota bacterium]MDR7519361.1 hypothetical protein [Armatimonadota bacterium]MDR7549516.1 hypothetical protein [Armatimonadota bacterium]